MARAGAALVAAALTWLMPGAALMVVVVAEGLERALYFKTVKGWRMPGA